MQICIYCEGTGVIWNAYASKAEKCDCDTPINRNALTSKDLLNLKNRLTHT